MKDQTHIDRRFLLVSVAGATLVFFSLLDLDKLVTKHQATHEVTFAQCCPQNQTVHFATEANPLSVCLHPFGSDIWVSDSVYKSNGNSDVIFEAGVRKRMLEVLAENKDPNAVVMDIGGNIGLHSLFLANAGYKVHAFEPMHANFNLFKCSATSNKVLQKNLILNNFGLGTVAGKTCITADTGNFGSAHIKADTNCSPENTIEVRLLDEYLEKHQVKPYLLKIDIEGFELKALQPAKEWFRKYPPTHVFAEFATNNLKNAGEKPEDYLQFYYDLGYQLNWPKAEQKDIKRGDENYKALLNTLMEDIHFSHPGLGIVDPINTFSCCPAGQAVHFAKEANPLTVCLHPFGSDIWVSDSVYKSNGNSDVIFEAGVRKRMLEVLGENKDPNAVVMDIGGNIGLHSLFLANAGYKVHAFEPMHANFNLFKCSATSNKVLQKNLILNNFGLGTVAGKTCITADTGNFGSAHIKADTNCSPENTIEVRLLDEYLEKHQVKPYLLKIDIEGFELKALQPAKEWFRKYPPTHVFAEFATNNLKNAGEKPEDYLQFYYDLGYQLNWPKAEQKDIKLGDENYKALLNTLMEDIHFSHPGKSVVPETKPAPVKASVDPSNLTCCPHDQSVSFKSEIPNLTICLHPLGKDLWVSDSVYKSNGNADLIFEAPLRQRMLEVLKDNGDPNAVVMDIGGNIGLHSLFIANAGYKVHTFEPMYANFNVLKCSATSNSVLAKNLILNNFGLGLVAGKNCMSYWEGNFGSAHIEAEPGNKCAPENTIEVRRLDEYLEKYQVKPYLLKIDIEGFELKALQPAKEWFKKYPPTHVFAEFATLNLKNAGEKPEDYLQFYYDLGYRLDWPKANQKDVKLGDENYKALLDTLMEDIHFYM